MQNTKILLLDDNLNFFTSLYGTFKKSFKVVLSNDPLAATRLFFTDAPFAAVVADYDMPGFNGLTFFEQLSTASPMTQRIVLATASDISQIITAVNAGKIDSFLQKPHTTDELLSIISSAVTLYNTLISPLTPNILMHPDIFPAPPQPPYAEKFCYNLQGLTPREQEILTMIASGESNQRIADSLGLTLGTIKSHCRNIFNKLGVSSRTQAIATFYSIKN